VNRTNVAVHEDVEQMRIRLENYLTVLHKKPNPSQVKQNKYAGNSNYLTVGYIEMELDK